MKNSLVLCDSIRNVVVKHIFQVVLYQREEVGDKLPSAADDGELVKWSDLGLGQVASEEECGQYSLLALEDDGDQVLLGHHRLPGPAGRQ